MRLHVRAEAPGIEDETFQRLLMEADGKCPVSNLLKHGLKLEITATLNERIQSQQAG
jgi:organic hydroperoxide reductase OsmC/OhrA